ncbi:polysaccharide lyase [uncultured Aquimarina sp.]|uniref:polysaccharide lyase n=1 Tax=uncultured Aquimarina sp. TaxID=575652 RepID=UPI002614CD0D|nr:T9SS type A sorting domain-containing protein [uncultured Aquimarina sp.]
MKLKLSKKQFINDKNLFLKTLVIFLFCFGTLSITAQTDGFANTFEYSNGTNYNQLTCQNDIFNCKYWRNSQNSDIQDKNLRIKFPKGAYGTNCGVISQGNLSGNDTYTLEYRVKFDNGFDWRLGGKLPGLAGGSAPQGGGIPSDGSGFSTRYMWRPNGRLVVYAYYKDQTNFYGDDWNVGLNFQTGIWYTLKQTVTVNTGNNANGRVEVWVNGEKKIDKNGLRLMSQENSVNRILFDTFMGGNDPSWSPDHTQYLRMDDFKCFKGRGTEPLPGVTKGSIEIEYNYKSRNDTGGNGIISPSNFNPGASGGEYVGLSDTNDELSTTFKISERGQYKLRLRVRTGEQPGGSTTNLLDNYEIKVKGIVKNFDLDNNSISSLDKDSYWGELTYTTEELDPGTHTIIIKAKSNWLKVDRLDFEKDSSSVPDPQDEVTSMITPNSVTSGSTVIIKVSYSASTDRDLFVNFQEESNFDSFASKRVPVAKGNGTIDISLNIPEDIPLGEDRYRITTHIGPTGTFWSDRLDFKYKIGIDAISTNEPADCEIIVRAAGQTGEEIIRLFIDNQFAYEWAITNTELSNYLATVPSGGNIKIAFINDGASSNGGDKNVRIDRVEFSGITRQSENAIRTGAGSGEWLWANGNFDYGNMECVANSNFSTNSIGLAKKLFKSSTVNISPNPVSEGFVKINGLNTEFYIKLYSFDGKEVLTKKNIRNSDKLNLNNITPGIYFIKIIDTKSHQIIHSTKISVQ